MKPVPNSVGMIGPGQQFKANDDHAQRLIASGHARFDDGTTPAWDGIRWPGATVVILASGPSLTVEQCEQVQVWCKSAGGAGGAGAEQMRRCIAINTTFRRAPWADVLYACDAPWWRAADDETKRHGFRSHCEEAAAVFRGELWTQDDAARREFRINWVESQRAAGLGKRPGLIHQGGNGGYQAMNLAYHAGAKRLILLGFDMHGTHWHGKYENGLTNTPKHLFQVWIDNFAALARDLTAESVEVVNCSPGSALKCFPAMDLAEALR
ncbi:MAG TPA: hypothetical protein VNU48_12990 [Burkholderiaceae bacterium]|nr:hypothetical protein [Burkholderiaceae bacterium]